jgi:hypothetical protein
MTAARASTDPHDRLVVELPARTGMRAGELATMHGFSWLMSSVGYLAGPTVVGEGLADLPANPHVRVVVAGLQGLDHSRDPGRGRAVGDGVDHVAANPWIGIPDQIEQPRPDPVVVGRVTGPRIIPPAGGAFGPLSSPGHPKWPGRLGQPRAARPGGRRRGTRTAGAVITGSSRPR